MRISSELRCWYAAVDWASEKRDIVVTDREGKRLGPLQVEHSGGGLARMADWPFAVTGGTPDEIHVAIEVPHGPIVDTLIESGFKVYSILPLLTAAPVAGHKLQQSLRPIERQPKTRKATA